MLFLHNNDINIFANSPPSFISMVGTYENEIFSIPVDDGDFDYRTIRQLFPHRGPNNITGTGLEMPDVLTAKICIHAVNTLGIIRRYLPDEEDSYKSCQYMPRR